MKKTLLLLCFFIAIQQSYSQERIRKPFFTGNFNFTFALNENYVLFDPDDGESMLDFSAIFLRTGFGFQFDEKWEASINFGLDFHTRLEMQAIPSYLNVQYNLFSDGDTSFFINSSYGSLWKPSSNFEKGTYYAVGIGLQKNRNEGSDFVLRLDVHRKKITGFKNGNLDSISLGIGFRLF
ncbi:MAG: hypothetical protein P8K77_02365 [Polaribacter sp.]|nr:hypothetical protein [Polaribacter sp.]